jgi:ribosome-binding protein aMBF1 (putative translation factor)
VGHFCRICGRERANEKFSGKGHKAHVCKDCSRLPAAERERIDIEEELFGFVRQSRISPKNKKRLSELVTHEDPNIKMIADLLIQVSQIAEGKRRRWKRVKESDFALYIQCEEAGLIIEPY